MAVGKDQLRDRIALPLRDTDHPQGSHHAGESGRHGEFPIAGPARHREGHGTAPKHHLGILMLPMTAATDRHPALSVFVVAVVRVA
jgi:hypothetical protein